MVNSHIQVPESLLKKFAHREIEINSIGKPIKSQYVYCLKLKTKSIELANIKDLNTQFGYYSDKAETQLSEIESSFGQCVTNVQNFLKVNLNKTNKQFNIAKYEQIVKDFVLFSMARAQIFKNKIQSKSELYKYFPEYYSHSHIIEKGTSAFKKLHILEDYTLTVASSEEYNFVLPKYCWYGGFIDKETITLPFSPNLAFILFPYKNLSNFLLPTGELGIITFEKEEIKYANRIALMSEQRADNEFIVAEKEQELLDLIKFLD